MKWLLILLLCVSAHAETSFSIGAGKTFGNVQGSGTWWQKEYPSYYEKTASSVVLRVDETKANGWSLGAGYAFIGNFNSDSQAVASDWAYEQHKPYPLSRWIGNQKMDGLFVVARYTRGPWYFEAGPIYTRTTFTMHIPNWVPCLDDPLPCVVPDLAKMQPLTVGNPNQRKMSAIVSAGYQIDKNLAIQFTEYPTYVNAGLPGIIQMYSGNVSVLYTF